MSTKNKKVVKFVRRRLVFAFIVLLFALFGFSSVITGHNTLMSDIKIR